MLLDVVPSPGFSDESVRVYLARGITEVGRPELGDDEEADLSTRWVSLPVAVRMVLGRHDRQRRHGGGGAGRDTLAAAGACRPPGRRAVAGPAHPVRRAGSADAHRGRQDVRDRRPRLGSDAMRFGLFVPQGWRLDLVGIDPAEQWSMMKGLAQHADAGPWESIWVYDHFHTVPEPTEEATHEAWTLMSAFGAVTERVRLGQMCTCMGYRNPAYLAKVAATCDIISGGRVEMGIGAGWYEHEWRAYGYGFPPAPERLGMLDEGVQIMRQAWTEGRRDARRASTTRSTARSCGRCRCRRAAIPLWIAGGGEKVTLRIAAKYAQYTNFDGTLEGFTHKSELLERALRGRRHRLRRDRPLGELQRRRSGPTEAEVRAAPAGRSRPGWSRIVGDRSGPRRLLGA